MLKQELRQNLTKHAEENISRFHQKRLHSLSRLKLDKILTRKNPYLYRAKNLLTSESIVRSILEAHLSSQEETMFGEFMEDVAKFVCTHTQQGYKSTAEGIDLEFSKEGVRYIITVKSGPNWGNSSQIKKMKLSFLTAKKIYGSNNPGAQVIAINGCCYGRDDKPDKGDYLKLCGQRFWEFISEDPDLYVELIEPIGHEAKIRNEEFELGYAKILNSLVAEFSDRFLLDGAINWEKIVKLNSAILKPVTD